MKKIYTFLLFLISSIAAAQLTVVSTEPANNATNVPLTATISITFSEALDTVAMNTDEIYFSNIDSDSMVSYGYSVDLRTTFGEYKLQPNTAYFLAFYYAKAQSGTVMTTPYVYYFTTGSDFPTHTVSGTLSSGSSGVTPENALVALSSINIMEDSKEGPPPFVMGATVNNDGSFTVPNVANGTYWPLAVKDVDHNGMIKPEDGMDVLALGDSIIVTGANLSGVNLEFFSMEPLSYADALHEADSLKSEIPNDCVLKEIASWDTDTTGAANDWQFRYTRSDSEGYQIRVSAFDDEVQTIEDMQQLWWLHNNRTLTGINSAAPLTTVIPLVENHGGREFRYAKQAGDMDFQIECRLGDHNSDNFSQMVPDQSKFYWGISYKYGYESDSGWYDSHEMKFLCDFTTGAVIAQATSVKEIRNGVPADFVLSQNYPNPFNPTTTIRFAIPAESFVTVKIYDMLGREIATLVNEMQSPGWKEVRWNGANHSSGIYLYRITANGFSETKKLMLLK